MEIIDGKALLLKLKNPFKVTSVIPRSKQIKPNEVLVKWGLEEAQYLRNINIKAPSPIRSEYKWPGKYKPRSHQIDTAEFLTLNKRAFCFNEMGTGKTASAIWAADYLMNKGIVNRVLIVAPLSILDVAWKSELFNCAMHRKVDIAYGSAGKRKKIINSDAEFVVINFDGISIVENEIANGGFDLIIADEANAYKNPQTKRWKSLRKLMRLDTWLWMMTGSPAAQSPMDAYGLAKLVNPSAVPQFTGSFRDMVMRKVSNFRWIPKPEATEVVHRVLQPAIRFTTDQCLDLPSLTYVKREVAMTPQQKKYYDQLRKQRLIMADGEEVSASNAAIVMNKLLQISSGCAYSDDKETIEFDISNRYRVLKEVIEESSQKVLVFAPFKHIIELLSEKLTADNISSEKIQGSVPPSKRAEIFKRFQSSPDPRILIIQPQAAAHGVTLTAANTVVWWGPTSSLETYSQANARVYRSGQYHPCTVVQLQGSEVERHVYRLLDNRIDVHSKIVDLYKEILD